MILTQKIEPEVVTLIETLIEKLFYEDDYKNHKGLLMHADNILTENAKLVTGTNYATNPQVYENSNNWLKLKRLTGYVQDGSSTSIHMFQDDATCDYLIQVGDVTHEGDSFADALSKFIEPEQE